MTFGELAAFCEGAGEAESDAWKCSLWQAWHAAAFARAKKLPDLKRLLDRIGPRRKHSWRETLRQVEVLNLALGGRDLRQKPGE